MENYEELRFSIPAYTPETIPLGRLVEYLRQVAAVIGADVSDQMHLIRIESSSVRPVFKMRPEAAARARQEAIAVRGGRGTAAQQCAYQRIRQMVGQDGGNPAKLFDRTGTLLDFPPDSAQSEIIANIRQATTFDGILIRIGGAGEYSAILMQDLSGEVLSGFAAPRALAKTMGKFLFDPIRVAGIANWDRQRNGKWSLAKMLIQSYEPLEDESLTETFQKLRAAAVDWPSDYEDLIRGERESTP